MKAAVYRVGSAVPDASKGALGGKAFGLHRMMLADLPASPPPAYVITVETCREYLADPASVMEWVREVALPTVKAGLTADFGYMPLVSVRSGAPVSMPGMLETVLNVGLDPHNFAEWEKRLGTDCATDCFARLQKMYGKVVGEDTLPTTADEQIVNCIEAVFKSWNNEHAKVYRDLNGIPHDMGTAVVVQAMVFGNFNEKSGSGVAFSRDYSTGEKGATGNWKPTEMKNGVLVTSQGEDVVSGEAGGYPLSNLLEWNPALYARLLITLSKLEELERDMVDVEFTVQDNKLYLLQVRPGKCTGQAALKIAVDLFNEKLISADEAISRISFKQFIAAGRPTIPEAWMKKNPAHGIGALDNTNKGASVGATVGIAVFSNEEAINCTEPCILVRKETSPDDLAGMNAATGILTASGGHTNHAAVVARAMDKVCVVGCTKLTQVGGGWVLSDGKVSRSVKAGTKIVLDGATASIWLDTEVPIEGGEKSDAESKFLDLISTHYDFYRTVTEVSELNSAPKVLLATYGFDRQLWGEAMRQAMLGLVKAAHGREVVIDLRTFGQVCREADRPLEMLWGALEAESDADVIDNKIQALELGGIPEKEKDRISVLELGLTPDQVDRVNMAGFATIPVITTIAELEAVNGMCVADFTALVKAAGKKEVMRIIASKRLEGQVVRSFNIVEKISPDMLDRNAVFALSAMQAAQCLLGGKG